MAKKDYQNHIASRCVRNFTCMDQPVHWTSDHFCCGRPWGERQRRRVYRQPCI